MQLRVRVLRHVRDRGSWQRVSELRRRLRAAAVSARQELEGRQLPRQIPASTKVKHRPVAAEAHEVFSRAIKELLPEQR